MVYWGSDWNGAKREESGNGGMEREWRRKGNGGGKER